MAKTKNNNRCQAITPSLNQCKKKKVNGKFCKVHSGKGYMAYNWNSKK